MSSKEKNNIIDPNKDPEENPNTFTNIDNIEGLTEEQKKEYKDFIFGTDPLKPIGVSIDPSKF